MAELGLGQQIQGGAQSIGLTRSCVLGILFGWGIECGAITAGGILWMATALCASAIKCRPLKQKNMVMISPFCNMCLIQSTMAGVPMASSSIPVMVLLSYLKVTMQGRLHDCKCTMAIEKVSCKSTA